MRNLLTHHLFSARNRPIATLLHVGAGAGGDVDIYAELAPARLVLVEGDPANADDLASAVEHFDDAQVIHGVITPRGEKTIFHRCSLPLLNGVLPPEELFSLYPRLRVMEKLELEGMRLDALLTSLDLNPDASNLLILDVPGLEMGLLVPEVLPLFEWILVCGSGVSTSASRRSLNDTLEILERSHFQIIARDASTDPAWPSALLKRDVAGMEINRLERREIELQQALAIQTEEHAREKAGMAERHAGEISDLVRAQEEKIRSAETINATLRSEIHELLATLGVQATALDEAHGKIAQTEAALQEAITRRDEGAAKAGEEITALHREMESQLASARLFSDVLSKGRDDQDRALKELERSRERLTADLRERDARIAELQEQLSQQARLHQRMSEEFVKAEAQIDLIKEFMTSPQLAAASTNAQLA